MITILWKDGHLCPVVICDVCLQPIKKEGGYGNVLHNPPREGERFCEIRATVHKKCDRLHELRQGEEHLYWQNLDVFLYDLSANTEVELTPSKKLRKSSDAMQRL